MSATMTATHACSLSRDTFYSRNNSAAPLPLIPRRPPSVPNSRRASPLVAPHVDSPPAGVIFTRASPPTTPAFSNLTEVPIQPPSPLTIKAEVSPIGSPSSATSTTQPTLPRRVRGFRFPAIRPPEQSTPIPAKANSGSDTSVRPNTSTPITRNLSESHVHTLAAAAAARSEPSPPLLRKKSGEPLKSSLKAKRTPARGSLTVVTDPVVLSSSKSAPATPAHKGVRFHSQLEQVKHFLAEQKPIAVSRDGSPTDTSGTDPEFPPFIYGRDDDIAERALVMHRIDVPAAPPSADDKHDIVVESVDLVGTTIEGVVRVRNIAFEKWVAVRFTLDKWQTTSEVTARYKESLHDGTIDRFTFSIKLADALSRAEEKTVFLAVRYTVAGREIWDNNSGRNYQVRIVREKPAKPTMVSSSEEKLPMDSQADDIAALRHKLEEVVKLGRPSDTIGGLLAQHSRRRWGSPSRTPTPPSREATPSFKSEASLAARYDFAASLRTPWRAPAAPSAPCHTRTNTYPSALNSVAWPDSSAKRAPCGSPRDPGDRAFFFPERDSDSDDVLSHTPPVHRGRSGSGSRNHTRGGAFELSEAPGVKRTPPASPFGSPEIPLAQLPVPTPPLSRPRPQSPARCYSFPPHSSPRGHPQAQSWVPGVSEESTPSITSSSSSRSSSPTPTSSPAEPVVGTRLGAGDGDEKCDSPVHHLSNYNILLNRFCFFTGSGPVGAATEDSDAIPRSFSASSVEDFLSVGQSPPLKGIQYRSNSPLSTPRANGRASSTASDDELQRSGSATPTGRTMRRLLHTPPTPFRF